MSIQPLITFKAGFCDPDQSTTPPRVKARQTPGYIYLYRSEEELLHFCWRPRATSLNSPELDLLMVPGDAQFIPYVDPAKGPSNPPKSSTNGRIFVLKFSSSSQRHLFWMQSKGQVSADPSSFGPRDLKLGNLVDQLLQGEEVDVPHAIAEIREGNDGGDGDDDEPMEDVEGTGGPGEHHRGGSGGAGPGATGGDVREEGEGPREGGADGGRAAPGASTDASSLVQDLLNSLQGGQESGSQQRQSPANREKAFTTLPDLLQTSATLPIIESADQAFIDNLLSYLPPTLLLLAQETDDLSSVDATPQSAEAAMEALSLSQKRDILRKVFRSPQFAQSLSSLTVALRDGGLPSVSEALRIQVENGGFMRRGGMPVGGGEAVEAFLAGVKRTVEEEDGEKTKDEEGRMDMD